MIIYTVGHSTRRIEEFIALLKAHRIKEIVDIRTIPKSRHNPQFAADALKSALAKEGIGYEHLRELGGLRRPKQESKNRGWRNESFRGFADYMATPEFAAGLRKLEEIASRRRTAIMCAEAVPWRCHRSLVADALIVKGWRVLDIMSETSAPGHKQTPFLHLENGRITYPSPE
jgi:uncharacterized protein (DUF488 family)